MNKLLIRLFFLAIFYLPLNTFAQAPNFNDDVSDTPIDGGVGILLAAGIGYGVKKYKDARKQQ